MKSLIGKIVLAAIVLFAFTHNVDAQRHEKRGVVKNTRTGKKTVVRTRQVKVPRTKIVYHSPNRKVLRYKVLPSKNNLIFYHQNLKYYYSGGFYYRMVEGYYVRTAPAFGLRIKVLPVGFRIIASNNKKFFYHQGVYYTAVNDEYEVVEPEPGLIIDELPEAAERVKVDDEDYYEYNNVLYKKTGTEETLSGCCCG
ncbi:MAG: hypothetical protein HC831_27730 [Chloroflexia bacterium]|nr:hypothetical protein [Chloroflexia bacterium]